MRMNAICRLKVCLAVLASLVCFSPLAGTIKSSVSPEFPDGLHTKYLQYLASQLDMQLDIYPMPFARRLQALKNGEIDIMVGLKGTHNENGQFVYVRPSYEKLRTGWFVLASSKHILTKAEHKSRLTMGITIDEKTKIDKAQERYGAIVPVTDLRQKIELLLLGRIDSFSHFEASAKKVIREMGLEQQVVLAPYQDQQTRPYHVAISSQSQLVGRIAELEQIIRKGVADGDFLNIREFHYAE